jgi:NAD(P)H-quinone oxidoreductase subunit 5
VVLSGALGALAGSLVPLDKFWSRSVLKPLRTVQDLLAYDFYTERFYRSTIVAFVGFIARMTDAFDREVVNRLVNRIGSASLVSAEGLKLAVSGQTQSYVLTVLLAIVLLLSGLIWWRVA